MADSRLEALEGQEEATADLREAVAAGRGVPREGAPDVVTLQEMRGRLWGHRHAAFAPGLMDGWATAVVASALLTSRPNACWGSARRPSCAGRGIRMKLRQ